MKRLWTKHRITLMKEDITLQKKNPEIIEIVIAEDDTIPLDCCFIQRQKGVFVTIKKTTLFNAIKDYVKKGYVVLDLDDIIPQRYKLYDKSKEKNLYINNQSVKQVEK